MQRHFLSLASPSHPREDTFDDTSDYELSSAFLLVAASEPVCPYLLGQMVAWSKRADLSPVVVITKVDEVSSPRSRQDELMRLADGAPIVAASAWRGDELDLLQSALLPGQGVAVIGPSGVGKTALCEALSDGWVRPAPSANAATSPLYASRRGGLLVEIPAHFLNA